LRSSSFEPGEGLRDPVEIGAVGADKPGGASVASHTPAILWLLGLSRMTIIARRKRRHEHLVDVDAENVGVHSAVRDQRGGDTSGPIPPFRFI